MAMNQSSITGPKIKQDRNADGDHERRKLGRFELEALDRAEHGDCGGDHAVAIEQRGADQPDEQERGTPAAGRRAPCVEESQKRDYAALAPVIGAHDQNGVFKRDDQDERPKDQRRDARNGFGRRGSTCFGGLLEGIERTSADVAVDNAQRSQSHGSLPRGCCLR